LAVCLLVVVGLLVLWRPTGQAFGGSFIADDYARFLKVLALIGSAATLIMSTEFLSAPDRRIFEYAILVLLSTLGMMVLISAGDLISLYLGLELMSLALYVVAASHRDNVKSTEAGLKYFVLGALSSGMLLYGASLIYGFTGTVSFAGIASAASAANVGLVFGLVFLLAGLCFKVSAVPFHMWTPDVYEGAPTPVTAFFASAPKVAAMALLTRVAVQAMGPAAFEWRQIVIFMALASTILGGVAAIGQPNIKRLLAYSSINNVGFALIGLAAATRDGVASVLFYMAVYIAMTLGAFLVVLRMRGADGHPVEAVAALSGLSRTRPMLALAMATFMFSLAGVPPLFGFWPKFLVFNAAVKADLTWLAAIGIATSVISAYYYLRIVKTMYFDEPAAAFAETRDLPQAALILVAALFVSPLGYFAIPYLGAAALNAAGALF
ncbi:MAG: NADH-quinone oxidoreductase subunit NuoN, partial [Alphaproteobacteria bacterium]|nr:NADH-quinone oxidoreductase subunit NuoN [Alphaproteobacteria bacterium]